MTIDDCPHDFATLAGKMLPEKMEKLEAAMKSGLSMAEFSKPGEGVASILSKHGLTKDFSGCYVLLDPQPFYVGISRGVYARLRQHVMDGTHFGASLAYRMAVDAAPHKTTRAQAMKGDPFKQVFARKQESLRKSKVATVPIDCPVELHLFEVYAALKLRTSKWNSFRTH